jgi:hypothetical protein
MCAHIGISGLDKLPSATISPHRPASSTTDSWFDHDIDIPDTNQTGQRSKSNTFDHDVDIPDTNEGIFFSISQNQASTAKAGNRMSGRAHTDETHASYQKDQHTHSEGTRTSTAQEPGPGQIIHDHARELAVQIPVLPPPPLARNKTSSLNADKDHEHVEKDLIDLSTPPEGSSPREMFDEDWYVRFVYVYV